MSSATFKLHYGSGFWEDYYEMTDGNAIVFFAHCFVQVRSHYGDQEKIIWTGIVPAESFKLLGESGGTKTADQVIHAYGLDWLLQSRLDGAWVEPVGGGTPVWINSLPTFNRRHEHGSDIIGNCSETALKDDTYIFSTSGDAVWDNLTIIEYLLAHYQKTNSPKFTLGGTWEILEALVYIDDVYDFSTMTLRQALNTLMSRARGFSWTYTVDSEGNVKVVPFSLLDESLQLGNVSMPANQNKVYVNLWENKTNVDVEITRDVNQAFDTIIVRGAKMKSCCSLQESSSVLEEAWTTAEETVYKDAAKNTDGYSAKSEADKAVMNDRFRNADRFSKVFTTFRIPRTWNWKIGSDIVNPLINSVGELITTSQAQYWNVDKRFLGYLPFKTGFDYSGSSPVDKNPVNSEPEQRKIFVLVKDKDGKYHFAEKYEPIGANVRPVTQEMGIEMRFNPQYIAAKNYWSGAEPSIHDPDDIGIDYTDIIITAFIETDQYVQLEHKINNYENNRSLIIDIADAELWYIVPGTIIDVDADGDCVEYGGSSNLLRDDTDRLRAAQAAAVACYGKQRYKVSINSKTIDPSILVGSMVMVNDCDDGLSGTAVTQVSWNLQNKTGTTKITTDFGELDIAGIFRDSGTISTPNTHVAAKKLEKIQQEVSSIKSQQGKSPVRATAPSTRPDIKVFEVQSNGTGDGVYTCRQEKILQAEWDDTTGADHFAEKSTDEYDVLNLAEHDPGSAGQHDLFAGDMLAVWRMLDDTGVKRFVGVPLSSCFRIHIYNNSGGTLSKNRFIELATYDSTNLRYTVKYPSTGEYGLARLPAGALCYMTSDLANNTEGVGWVGGIFKITLYASSEDIAVGDFVGYYDSTGKAIKGGPYICLKVDATYCWCRRADGL
jgi:hypothetical protein